MEQLQIDLLADGGYSITGPAFKIESKNVTVTVNDNNAALRFGPTFEEPAEIGGAFGAVTVNESSEDGISVRREVFLSSDQATAAIRVSLANTGDAPIRLNSIETMRITDQSSFVVGESGIDKWKVLRYPFHKSDIPSYYRPTVVDKDFSDASFSCINAIPGKGVLYNLRNIDSRTITSGPVMMVKNIERGDLPVVMLCTLGIEDHFILMSLTTAEDRTAFEDFNILCDFDGMVVEPGQRVATHWLMIACDPYEGSLLEKYVDTVARIYDVKIPDKPSLTVYCTWYFYTFLVSEQYVLDELRAIEEREIPVDVFQIDDGWMDTYGTYEPHPTKFPNGMRVISERIKKLGIIPGIWVAPFVVDCKSPTVKQYPDIYQRDADGNHIIYETDRDCYVLDPTAEGAKTFLQDMFAKLKGWGYSYFKLDWLRVIYEFPNVVFHNPNYNRSAAYFLAMRYIRDVIGEESYLLACGGLADPGNIGLVNGNRTSKDVRGVWDGPEDVPKSGALIQLKQNLLRSYTNRLYDGDPDATQIRIRETRFSDEEVKCVGVYQSEGRYTDEEARTICTHQFLCGGLITISERFPELQESRLAMLRHISPAITRPAYIVDYDSPVCPSVFLNDIEPQCKELGRFWLLTLGNWEDSSTIRVTKLRDISVFQGDADRYAVFEFFTQELLGVFTESDAISIEVPAHGVRVLRIVPWDGTAPVVLGTDLHLTGGASEITELDITSDNVKGTISTRWRFPVTITVGFSINDDIIVQQAVVPVGGCDFEISRSTIPISV